MINGSLRVFQPDKYNRISPARVVLMIVGIDNKTLEVPKLIMQSCWEQSENSCNFESVLLTRFAKKYNPNGSPNFIQIDLNQIFDRVFVIEDFLELFEREYMRKNLMMSESALPVDWYGESTSYNYIMNKNLSNSDCLETQTSNIHYSKVNNHEHLQEDWAYVVLPYNEWHELFTI